MSRFARCARLAFVLPFLASCGPSVDAEVAAWEAYCDRLKETGSELLRAYPQPHEIDRQEALSYLAQQVAFGVRDVLIAEDTSFPLLRLGASTIDKWGLDGADAKYLTARIVGDGVYRLHGRLGSAALIAMQSFRMEPDYEPFASMSGADWAAAVDGTVDVRVSADRPEAWTGAWLEIDPGATTLLIREYFNDWERERPSALFLERLDSPVGPPVPDFAGRLDRMADAFAHRAPMWLKMSSRVRSWVVNELATPPSDAGQGLKNNVYGQGWYQISDDEALLIELDAPDALIWSFQLGNFWWESSDYINRTGSLNGHQAIASSDGRYRIVVALADPGVPNWLDPAGRPEGAILYRYQQAKTAPQPEARLVPVSELHELLPADTLTVSPGQRAAEIASRRAHGKRRWAP